MATHWVYGSGSAGCLYDNTGCADTREQAIESALFIFDTCEAYEGEEATNEAIDAALAEAREHLRTRGIYFFPTSLRAAFGADYVEVSEHDGPCPEEDY